MFQQLIKASLSVVIVTAEARVAHSDCREYRDSEGNKVVLHPRSFVDKVVCPGKPGCSNSVFKIAKYPDNDPSNAIGPPTYKQGRRVPGTMYSLGCRGLATWEFVDNLIVDVPGPDIMIFEVGTAKEPTRVEISADGLQWLDVGRIGGSTSSVDISTHVKRGQTFRFIRLTDLGDSCRSATAGADIDAIATFGYSWTHVEDDSSVVFFDTGRWVLKDDAKLQMDRLVAGLPPHVVRIVGHTDAVGRSEDNMILSLKRAQSVAEYLTSRGLVTPKDVEADGRGAQEPISSNVDPAGRARNRRVELTFIPLAACPQQ
jgi:outer membrane protein OmpA-like peptidoglycan-associated protein